MKAAQFDFVSFDDDELITENALIKDLSPEHLKVIFSEHQMGHYLPLTTLTYALTYKFFGEAPTPFHIFSILLHLICSWLVFLFIKLLTKSQYIALGVSVVFALHPMNTESVAWISSRSNLMFSLFYLASMIQYLRYNQSSDLNKILSVYLFFGLGLLCKSAMLTLPLTLLLIDWYQEGKITRKQIIGKIPLCIASFVFGILAIHFAGKFGTLNNPENFSSVERFCIGFRALIMQIEKFVLPINQSAIHFNPRSESIPTIVYLSPVIFLGIASIAFLKRNKTVIFGLIFFLIQMILVSQFIGIGNTITAERYAYLSHIGISLVLFTIILRFVKSQILRTSVLIMIVAILGILSFNRMDVWKNSESLYSNVISVYPDYGYGYYGLALAKQQQSLFKESLSLLDLAIEKESYFPNAINNRGNIKVLLEDYLGALKDYNLCIKQNDQYAEAYYNRGILLARQRNFGLAKKDLEKAMESGLATDGVHKQYANVLFQMRLYDEALEIYQDLSSKNATAELDIKIGNCYFQKQHLDHALKSYFLAVSKDSLSPEAYYNLGNVFAQMDSIESRSCGYWKRALDLGMYSAKKNIDSFCGISNKKIP